MDENNNNNNDIKKQYKNLININFEKKGLKPLKKLIGLFNIIILINFFILQFNNISHLNYYFQIILNEILCIYLWIEIRERLFKYHIGKIKIILFSILLLDIFLFIYQLKNFKLNIQGNDIKNDKLHFDFIILIIIYITNILYNILCLLFIFTINKFFKENHINNINNNI